MRIPATGAQIGAILWGVFSSGVFFTITLGSYYWWIGIPVYLFCAAACIRSRFLSVTVRPGAVVVASWFRTYRYVEGEVASVDFDNYTGAGGFSVGFVPFIGSIRMIVVARESGRVDWLPVTVGRRNSVLRLARRMRVALGLPSR